MNIFIEFIPLPLTNNLHAHNPNLTRAFLTCMHASANYCVPIGLLSSILCVWTRMLDVCKMKNVSCQAHAECVFYQSCYHSFVQIIRAHSIFVIKSVLRFQSMLLMCNCNYKTSTFLMRTMMLIICTLVIFEPFGYNRFCWYLRRSCTRFLGSDIWSCKYTIC